MRRKFSDSVGFGIMSAIAGVAITSMAVIIFASLSKNFMAMESRSQNNTDLAVAKQMVLENINCKKTIGTLFSICDSGQYMTLRDKNNKTIISAAGSKYGSWTLVSKCETRSFENQTINEIHVYPGRLKPGGSIDTGDFRKDPFTQKLQSFGNLGSLFATGLGLCKAYYAQGTQQFCPLPGKVIDLDSSGAVCPIYHNLESVDVPSKIGCCVLASKTYVVTISSPDAYNNYNITVNYDNRTTRVINSALASEISDWHRGCHLDRYLGTPYAMECTAAANRFCHSFSDPNVKTSNFVTGAIVEALNTKPFTMDLGIQCSHPVYP